MYQIITLYLLNVPVTCQLDLNKAGGKKKQTPNHITANFY